jgi:hypothetical protein
VEKICIVIWTIFTAAFIARADVTNPPPMFKIAVTSPLNYQVFQRATREQGKLTIAGSIILKTSQALPPDALEARLTGKSILGDLPGKWQRLPFDARVASFRGQLPVPAGGWYRLEVRALQQKVPWLTNAVGHVGVGEIFVIAGQSNAANSGEKKSRTETGLVAAFDGTNWQLAADPEPGTDGNQGSFMPIFGDDMVRRFFVPIGLVPTAVSATSVREWLPAGIPFYRLPALTRNVVTIAPGQWESSGRIFDRFTARMRQLGPNGFRAVLWHQGESDATQTNAQNTLPGGLYRQYLEQVISHSRQAIGWDAPWFVAQASYHNPDDPGTPDLLAAQMAVCDDGYALPGPDTDILTGPMREKNGMGIHLSAAGLKEHAQLWMDKVAPWMERQLDEPPKPGP